MSAQLPHLATPSLLGGTWTILRARLQVTRNTFWRGKLRRKIATILVGLILVALSYGLYRASGFVVRGLQQLAAQPEAREFIAELGSLDRIFAAVPSLALASFALPMLLSSVSFALSTLYLARDLEALLVTPVPVRSVFLARYIEGLIPTYLGLFVLLAPALIGYGQALQYGLGFMLAVVAVLLLLPLLPVSIGTFLTMLLVRFIPAQRLREVLTVLGGVFGLAVYIGIQSLNRVGPRLVSPTAAEQLLRFDLPALPTSWGARLLIAAGERNIANVAFFGAIYAAATLGLFVVSIAVAERVYLSGVSNMSGTAGGRVRQRRAGGRGQPALLSGPIGAILRKDLRSLPRDLQQLSQLILPLAIVAFWIWRLLTDRDFTSREIRSSAIFADYGLVITGIVVCVLITRQVGLTGLSREGRSYWLLHLAPIDPLTTLIAKTLLAWLPFGVLGTIFVALIGVLQRPAPLQLLQDWLLFALTGVGVAGITVGFGAAFPRLDWQQPQKMASARAGCLGTIAYMLYIALMLGAIGGAAWGAVRWGAWTYAAGWGAGLLVTGLALVLPLLLGARRLRQIEL